VFGLVILEEHQNIPFQQYSGFSKEAFGESSLTCGYHKEMAG